jgi:hypothetical protein
MLGAIALSDSDVDDFSDEDSVDFYGKSKIKKNKSVISSAIGDRLLKLTKFMSASQPSQEPVLQS